MGARGAVQVGPGAFMALDDVRVVARGGGGLDYGHPTKLAVTFRNGEQSILNYPTEGDRDGSLLAIGAALGPPPFVPLGDGCHVRAADVSAVQRRDDPGGGSPFSIPPRFYVRAVSAAGAAVAEAGFDTAGERDRAYEALLLRLGGAP